jgi:hypothetical protein
MPTVISEFAGGAPGGSTGSVAVGQVNVASGGAGAGYIKARLTAAQIGASQAVTIGTGGAAPVPPVPPVADTFFGALLQAKGGSGGVNSSVIGTNTSGTIRSAISSGGGFVITTGTDLGSSSGVIGFMGEGNITVVNATTGNISAIGGKGGDTAIYNNGGSPSFVQSTALTQTANGGAGGTNTGSGGGGSLSANGAPGSSGGAGGSGKVIITEYF